MAITPPVALVTGASSGIGAAYARRLGADGHEVVLVARRRARLEAVAEQIRARGGRAQTLVADLSTDQGLAEVEARVGQDEHLTVLVNNAGSAYFGPFARQDPRAIEDSLRVMVLATVRLSRAAVPGMCARGRGSVINMASRSAFGPEPNHATYAAAKAYILRLTLALAEELVESGVRVVAVCPGPVRTEIFDDTGIDRSILDAAIEPEVVVDASLRALSAGEAVCVPDERRPVAVLRRLLPRRLVIRAWEVLGRLSQR